MNKIKRGKILIYSIAIPLILLLAISIIRNSDRNDMSLIEFLFIFADFILLLYFIKGKSIAQAILAFRYILKSVFYYNVFSNAIVNQTSLLFPIINVCFYFYILWILLFSRDVRSYIKSKKLNSKT